MTFAGNTLQKLSGPRLWPNNLHSFETGKKGSFFIGVHGLDALVDKMACDMTVIVRSLLRSCVFETRDFVGMHAS
jgi:hypothetical protein